MKFSEQWLREWVNPAVSTDELSEQLTMAGLEVDAAEPAAADFQGVVVGEVLGVAPHPDADKLRVCQVGVGEGEPLNIVCGAANVREGLRVPTAVVGARLPGEFKIKKAKLRGVESRGMLCSAKELGLAETSEGLMELPADAPVGRDIRDYLALDDTCIELGLTPNRGDCLSIGGVAREVGVVNRCEARGPEIPEIASACDATHEVEIEAGADCPRYVGRVIQGIDIAAHTPIWMQERLRRSGIRSLGPLVDVTNYVLLELGQPMHAFDLAKLRGPIRVRRGNAGEKLELLNETTIEVDGETLVIADDRGPVALAGIMGGSETAVDDRTDTIFLESAFFTPETIAGRARRYGLHTDSSHRFERGVSPDLQRRAVERATALLLDIVGGEPGPVVEAGDASHLLVRSAVTLRQARLSRVLGVDIPADEVTEILQRLGMDVVAEEGLWSVTPPPFRFDIAMEEDLIEEVGRIYGYNRLPSAPPGGGPSMGSVREARVGTAAVRAALTQRGYHEAITYSFVDPKLQSTLDPDGEGIALANPISADMSVMRTGLWPGLVQALRYNVNRQQPRVRLFEIGLRFRGEATNIKQERVLGGAIYGSAAPEQWGERGRPVDFYDIKGDVEALLALGDAASFGFEAASHPALHPGQSARILRDGEPVGWLGSLHPTVERSLELPGRTFVFEVQLAALEQGQVPKFGELSKFPAIRRDLAIVLDESVAAEQVLSCVTASAPETLIDLKLFDVYQGEGIDSGRKSLALGLTLQANYRTLTDSEVDAAIEKIVQALNAQLGATLRD